MHYKTAVKNKLVPLQKQCVLFTTVVIAWRIEFSTQEYVFTTISAVNVVISIGVWHALAVHCIPKIATNAKTAVVGQKWSHSNELKTPF